MMRFIDESKLVGVLKKTEGASSKEAEDILGKALLLDGLGLEEAAVLLQMEDMELLEGLFTTAKKIKNEIYGKRLVFFAPLYISNYCSNNCLYCGFRKDNKEIVRRELSIEEIKTETRLILEQGHKRILLLSGEDENNFELIIQAIEAIYSVKDSKGSGIRRVNLEIAPLEKEQFGEINKAKIGTYTVFQETYHRKTYRKMHPEGMKADYERRLNTMDMALESGLNDVGIGALFGLYDYKFEVLALLQHAKHLDTAYGIGPHTISVPRVKPANNAFASMNIPKPVSDIDFRKLVAVLRLAVPYTGIILSTREPMELRTELFNLGVSQISAGSKTSPGGYSREEWGQFSLNDTRSTGEVIKDVINRGFVPSFCTGCYRLGRVGKDFMDLAKPGLIKVHCLPNSLTTLQEYLEDYADAETKEKGEELIEKMMRYVPRERKKKTEEYLHKIRNGVRDLYF